MKPNLYLRAVMAGAFAMLTYGWDAGVLGGILETAEFQKAMGNPTTTIMTMFTSVFLLASWLGCVVIAIIGDRMGRKYWLITGNIISIIGTVITASSFTYGQLIAGRVFVGIGNGFLTSMAPVYIAEYAVDKRARGRGVNAMIAIAEIGTTSAYWIDFGMTNAKGQAVWRFPIAFQAFFSIVDILALWVIPDTPRYYYSRGRTAEGDSVLERLHSLPLTAPEVQLSKDQILASIEIESQETAKLRLKDFFWDTSDVQAARRIRTGIIIFSLAYLQGLDMFYYYVTTIFQVYLGLKPEVASALAAASTTCAMLSTWVTNIFMEKLGRKTWLMLGSFVQGIITIILIGLIAHPGYKTGAAASAMMFCYYITNGLTWAPLSAVYPSEIMPLRYRHVGFSLSISAQWLFAWLTVFAGPIAAERSGWRVFVWFLVFDVIAIPYVYFCCPEPRGKSLEEVDMLFVSDKVHKTDAMKILGAEQSDTPTDSAEDGAKEKVEKDSGEI